MIFTETEFNELPDDLKEMAHDKDFGDDNVMKEIADFSMINYIGGLKSALSKTRDEKKELSKLKQQQQKTIDHLKMEQQKIIAKMKADGTSSDEEIEAVQKEHESALEKLGTEHATAIEAKDAEIVKMNKKLEKKDRKLAVRDAIEASDGNPKLLEKIVMPQTATVEGKVVVIDENGETRLTADGKEMTVADLLASMRDDSDFAGAFKGTGHSGNDSLPGGGDRGNNLGGSHRPTHRSQMTKRDKVNYIRQHGDAAFQSLPL